MLVNTSQTRICLGCFLANKNIHITTRLILYNNETYTEYLKNFGQQEDTKYTNRHRNIQNKQASKAETNMTYTDDLTYVFDVQFHFPFFHLDIFVVSSFRDVLLHLLHVHLVCCQQKSMCRGVFIAASLQLCLYKNAGKVS